MPAPCWSTGRPCARARASCTAVPDGADVRTLDGLASGRPHPLQAAFVDHQAAQCAFCINGMVMGSLGWLERRIAAGGEPLNYLCRCGAHNRIVAAIRQAAGAMVK